MWHDGYIEISITRFRTDSITIVMYTKLLELS